MNVLAKLPAVVQRLSEPAVRNRVAEFLGTELPVDFAGEGEITMLDYQSITGIIRERRPWFMVDKCVAVKSLNDFGKPIYTVWGSARFTEDMAAGHFPGSPKLPFVDLVKMMAQVAIVAAALQADDKSFAPIGVGSSGSSADAKDLIVLPATILAKLPIKSMKMGLCTFADSHAYVNGEIVGTITGIRYALRRSPELAFT